MIGAVACSIEIASAGTIVAKLGGSGVLVALALIALAAASGVAARTDDVPPPPTGGELLAGLGLYLGLLSATVGALGWVWS